VGGCLGGVTAFRFSLFLLHTNTFSLLVPCSGLFVDGQFNFLKMTFSILMIVLFLQNLIKIGLVRPCSKEDGATSWGR
jgi:hypothetical protein